MRFQEIAATWTFEGGLSVLEEFSTFPEELSAAVGVLRSAGPRRSTGSELGLKRGWEVWTRCCLVSDRAPNRVLSQR